MTTKLRITTIPAASVDIGDPGMPGSGATEITCEITARRDGRWEAVGCFITGSNQGYFQQNYRYGPWLGRGPTAKEAVADMVRRADDEYRDAMRRAGHDALLEADDSTFAGLAAAEASRIQAILDFGEVQGATSATIAGVRYYADSAGREDLRKRAVRMLRKMAIGDVRLANVSDDELLAEIERRGLLNAAAEDE